METQFLIGNELMVAPILEAKTTERSVYFPKVNWYLYESGQLYRPGTTKLTGNKPSDMVPLFVR
jgi:alpha-glucosidase (family GH31 glycosyl hydrolase)